MLIDLNMRILYFSARYTPHDHRFLSALAKTRHQVSYLRLEKQQLHTEDRPVPAEVQQLLWAGGRGAFRWGKVPRLVLDLNRVISEVKPDLIHAGPIQTCAFLSVLSGFRPVLTMSWGFDLMQDAERDAWWRWVTRFTLRRSSFFASDAVVTRDKAVRYGMRPDRTRVFPWGVDLQQFAPGPSDASRRDSTAGGDSPEGLTTGMPKSSREPFVLLCSRSWEARYGVDVLARAFVKAARRHPDLSLILLGGGSQAQAIRQILENGGIIERVHFGGRVPNAEVPRWYHMADLFVSPSHVDGSSVSLMEALACGLPVLASDIPANKEWVQDGANGWLYPDGNEDALAERISTIIREKRRLPGISRAARQTAEARADWRKNFAVLLEAYDEALLPV